MLRSKPRKANHPITQHQFRKTKIARVIDVDTSALGDLQHPVRHFEVTWSFRIRDVIAPPQIESAIDAVTRRNVLSLV